MSSNKISNFRFTPSAKYFIDDETLFLISFIKRLQDMLDTYDKTQMKVTSFGSYIHIGFPHEMIIHFDYSSEYYPLISPIYSIYYTITKDISVRVHTLFTLKLYHDKEIINLLSTIYDLVVKIEPSFESCF